jgi:protein involved in polysaccharide export with SLBB domain
MNKAHFLPMLVAALLLGCESAKQSTSNAEGDNGLFVRATQHQIASREYRVDPPDEIIVKAPKIAELDGVRQRVRPDGKISLNLVGDVYVVGMTPAEINALLKKLVSKYYDADPDVKVEVVANSKFYYVFGQGVQRQGRYAYTGRDTVVTAMAEAGFNEAAWPQQVMVSRPAKNDQDKATAVVDFKHIFETGDLSQNYLLEEGDIINIRASPLASWDMKTRRLLGPLTGTAGAVTAGAQVAQPTGAGVQGQ